MLQSLTPTVTLPRLPCAPRTRLPAPAAQKDRRVHPNGHAAHGQRRRQVSNPYRWLVVGVVVGVMVGVMVGVSRVPLSPRRAVSGTIRRRKRRIENPLVEEHFDVARGARDR